MLHSDTCDDLRHLHVKDGLYVQRDPLDIIIENHRAILQPAMSLERVGDHAEDHTREETIARQEFEQRQRVE